MKNDRYLDELLKLAEPATVEALKALEADNIPWRPPLEDVTNIVLRVFDAMGKIVALQPALGTKIPELRERLMESHAYFIREVNDGADLLRAMAKIAQDAAFAHTQHAEHSCEDCDPNITTAPKDPSQFN